MSEYLIREAEAEELNFVYATWLNSYYGDSLIGQECRKTIFFNEYPSIVDNILNQPLTKIFVAAIDNVILSYIVFEPGTLHYLFTKEIYRRQGVAKDLFHRAFHKTPVIFTHRTQSAEPIIQKFNMLYNPFKLFKQLHSVGDTQ